MDLVQKIKNKKYIFNNIPKSHLNVNTLYGDMVINQSI